jgi:hypothetical protein
LVELDQAAFDGQGVNVDLQGPEVWVELDRHFVVAEANGQSRDHREAVGLGMETGLDQVAVGVCDQAELAGCHEREVPAVEGDQVRVAMNASVASRGSLAGGALAFVVGLASEDRDGRVVGNRHGGARRR